VISAPSDAASRRKGRLPASERDRRQLPEAGKLVE
jgi:hypothetical protein